MMQPLRLGLVVLMLGGCSVSQKTTIEGPVTTSLHSEFNTIDEERSFYGPFLAATQAQQDAKHKDSAYFYMQALDADPTSKFVADRAFFQLLVSGRMDDAAKLALKIAREKAGVEDDLVRLMYALEAYKRQDWPAVRERLEGQISSGFGYIIAPILEAWSYGAEGNVKAARETLKVLESDKRLITLAHEHLAYILDYAGETKKAAAQYKKLMQSKALPSLQPAVAYAYFLYQDGQKQQARDFLGVQARKYNNHSFLLREGARITQGLQPTQAVATPRGAAGMIFFRLATEFSQGNSLQAALVYYRIATYMTPEVTDIYFMLGSLLERVGNVEGAAAALDAVPPTSPLRKLADTRRIEILRAGGHLDQAEELLRYALTEDPDDYEMLVGLADLLQQREMFEESIVYYDKAIQQQDNVSKRDWVVYFSRGVSYERTGQWARAEKDLEKALSLSPDEPSVLNYLGYSWIDRGQRINQAKAMIEKAVKARPEDGFIVDSLGWVYYLTGEYARAVQTLEKAVRLEPGDATINDHLGDAYWRVGRKIEARFQWRHALEGGVSKEDEAAILNKIETGLPPLDPAKGAS